MGKDMAKDDNANTNTNTDDTDTANTLRGPAAAAAARALEQAGARDIGPPEAHGHGDTVVRIFKPGKGRDYAMRLDAIWRMVDKGIIEERHAKAADKFNLHFERAALGEHYQTINLFRVTGGIGDFTDDQMFHREQARRALDWLGKGLEASVVWHVAGARKSISSWCRVRFVPMHNQVATGLLLAGLDRLAEGYGIDY
jgi:hypothetical protein